MVNVNASANKVNIPLHLQELKQSSSKFEKFGSAWKKQTKVLSSAIHQTSVTIDFNKLTLEPIAPIAAVLFASDN